MCLNYNNYVSPLLFVCTDFFAYAFTNIKSLKILMFFSKDILAMNNLLTKS